MLSIIYAVCALCGWGGTVGVSWASRGRWTAARTALVTGLGLVGAGMALWALSLTVDIDAALGLNEIARLGTQLCVMGICASISVGMLHVAYPWDVAWPRSRNRIVGVAVAAVWLVALYTRTLGKRA